MSKIYSYLIMVSLLLLLFGCNNEHESQVPQGEGMETKTYTVKSDTQLWIGDIGVGVAGIDEREYLDDEGNTQKALSAGLWIHDKSAAEPNEEFFLVRAGHKITSYGLTLLVLDINQDKDGTITLRVVDD